MVSVTPVSFLDLSKQFCSFEGIASSADLTQQLGAEFSHFLAVNTPICLWGNLGSGKTTFSQGLIQEWLKKQGIIPIEIQSPTFTLLNYYETPHISLVHGDLYRLESLSEVHDLGLDELLEDHILVIEWPDRWGEFLPKPRYDIHFHTIPQGRRITIDYINQ
jgi:tRNA threonylcarbamoyl adenosine modification protein YjeE